MSNINRGRRSFIKELALGLSAAPFLVRRLGAQAPSQRIRHATFGTSGMAWEDLMEISTHPAVEIVAGCDVDQRATVKFRQTFPKARVYSDYRELLAQEKDLQSVNVSTPDHMHAPIGLACMQRGLHVYGQKPLTHDLGECRRLTEFAREKKLVTQMGIQVHSESAYRTAVKVIQDGAIGKVKEVHTWSSKKWGDNGARPAEASAVPEELAWDLWIGVAGSVSYIDNEWYHPGNWRKRLDFGTGTFGDMGCHIYDPVFNALALTSPISVRSEGAEPNEHSWATAAIIHYLFPGTAFTAGKTVEVIWYDGDQRPPEEIKALARGVMADGRPGKLPDQGSIFLGTDGVMVLPHVGKPRLIGEAVSGKPIEIVETTNHWHDFINAILGKGTTSAGFDYSGPLTEAVLLGCLATRFPKTTLEWNAAKLEFTNVPAANAFVHRSYRKGWEIAGL